MRVLPAEVGRCRPTHPDAKCNNCKRWADHPEQIFGNVTFLVNTTDSRDKAFIHVPISLLKEQK